jgi:hypothetical protein
MGPTAAAMRQAGYEDGLAGAKVVGNTDNYLAGYAEGEAERKRPKP